MSDPQFVDPTDPQTKVRNMVLDFFYAQIRLGKTNQEIFAKLRSTNLPSVSEPELNVLRQKFKDKEQRFPDKMAVKRARLRVP